MSPAQAFLPPPPLISPCALPSRSSLANRRQTPRATTPSYDDFDKLLGGGGNGVDGTKKPSKKPDPRDYSRFKTLLERNGGGGRKLKAQKRYATPPQSGSGSKKRTGDEPAGAAADRLPGGVVSVPKADTSRLGSSDIQQGYDMMDAFLNADDRADLDFEAPKHEKPALLKKPGVPNSPDKWIENWEGVPDPTRKKVASLDDPSEVSDGPKPTLIQKPGGRKVAGSGDFSQADGGENDKVVPKADTSPLGSEQIARGYEAMDAFLRGEDLSDSPKLNRPGSRRITEDPSTWRGDWESLRDTTRKKAASLDSKQSADIGPKPTLSQKPLHPATQETGEPEKPGRAELVKPRRVTEDPETWREDWEGVPDPTRKVVASLDNVPKVSGAPKVILAQKPTASVMPELDEPAEQSATELTKPTLRRVTEDPNTWREDWNDVPDPTRKIVASLDTQPKNVSGPKPTLVQKPVAPVQEVVEEPAPPSEPELQKPVLRRVTDDPDTWRKGWEGVPDPTRKPVADLDRPLPKLDQASPVSTLELVSRPDAPSPDLLAAALPVETSPASSSVPESKVVILPALNLKNPRIVVRRFIPSGRVVTNNERDSVSPDGAKAEEVGS